MERVMESPLVPLIDDRATLRKTVERKAAASASILVLEDDHETDRDIASVLGSAGAGYSLKVEHVGVGAQLLLRRSGFEPAMLAVEATERVAFYRLRRARVPGTTPYVDILRLEDVELARIDAMELDGVVHRPVAEFVSKATVSHVLMAREPAAVC